MSIRKQINKQLNILVESESYEIEDDRYFYEQKDVFGTGHDWNTEIVCEGYATAIFDCTKIFDKFGRTPKVNYYIKVWAKRNTDVLSDNVEITDGIYWQINDRYLQIEGQ